MSTQNGESPHTLVVCQNSHGMEIRANVLRLTRHLAVLEVYTAALVLRTSEVLPEFRVIVCERTIYSGRAVVSNIISTGVVLICEVVLEEKSWRDVEVNPSEVGKSKLEQQFHVFLEEWQRLYKVSQEYKVVLADMQSYFSELRAWLDQIELGVRTSPAHDRAQLERAIIEEVAGPIIRAIDSFVDQFETLAEKVDPEFQPAHRAYLRRLLHPLLLCSPFAYRAYNKPLGYAGDYEIVDMMVRPPYEGSSLFSKVINVWLLGQAPALAHRNRVEYLKRKLVEEAVLAKRRSRPLRVYNLGCGPAAEIQAFLKEEFLADQVSFTLLDFNEETLTHARSKLEQARKASGRSTPMHFVKRSVQQILKDAGKNLPRTPENQFDFIYCAGLFDYLSDPVCKRLTSIFYDMVSPGGLVLITNVGDAMNRSRPFKHSMDYMLGWHLIYRNGLAVGALAPDRAPAENRKVLSEGTGVNFFLELRKGEHD